MQCTFRGVLPNTGTTKCPACGKYQDVTYTKRFHAHKAIKQQHEEPSWQQQPDGTWQWKNVHVTFDHSVLDVEYREHKEDPETGKIKKTSRVLQH